MSKALNILITNDDGVNASGLRTLTDCMKSFGNLTIVAPQKPMSGVGHAISMRSPIMVEEVSIFGDIPCFAVDGTPADCVKFALGNLYKHLPDLIVSGINHGSNASVNMLYSGTVAAAVEGALYGCRSIAFSNTNYDENADMRVSRIVVNEVVKDFIQMDFPPFTLLNVNIPSVDPDDFKGILFCRQSLAQWKESFKEDTGMNGKKVYWLTGEFICHDREEGTDIYALENGFASLVPVTLDLTSYAFLNKIQKNIYAEGL